MKLTILALSLSLIFATGASADPAAAARAAGGSSAVLAAMGKAADWQLAHPAREKMDGWVQGAFLTGLSALDGLSASPRYLAALLRIGEGNGWKLGPRVYHSDDMCVGQTYLELYFREHDPRMLAAMRERCDYIMAHPKDDNLQFVGKEKNDRWSWCDSLFMGPPGWIRLYAATGNRAYLDYLVEHWWKTSAYLYDPAEHLYYRDSTYFGKHEANGKKVFWARGNGWVLAGLARVLEYLPADHPSRPRFERQFREIAARVRELQQPDGFWRTSLLDPDAFPLQEASGTGFLCFGITWGVNHGLLDPATFTPTARKAWQAILSCEQPDGKIVHVQPIGAAPDSFAPESTEAYGPGAFLLAGSEIYRLDGGVPKK